MVAIKELSQLWFFWRLYNFLISEGFANAGSYQGLKQNIWLVKIKIEG